MENKLFEESVEEEKTIEADDMGLSPEEAAFLRGYEESEYDESG